MRARGYTLKEMGFFASLPLAAGVVGDICGGVFSDMIIHRTGRIKFARQSVAIVGFLIAAVCCPLAVLEPDRYLSAALFGVRGVRDGAGGGQCLGGDPGHRRQLRRLLLGGDEHLRQYRGRDHGHGDRLSSSSAYGWNAAFYVVSVALAVLGARCCSPRSMPGRKLAPDRTSPVV